MKPSILENIPSQYIINERGKKTGVILDIDIYERLLEELEDLYLGKTAEVILKNDKERYSLKDIEREILKKKVSKKSLSKSKK